MRRNASSLTDVSDKEQTDAFAKEVNALIDRFRGEYDLSYAQAIGVFQLAIFGLCTDALHDSDDGDA
jgi:hypothetical protein